MIFTNCSWVGDFYLLWPVASWYYQQHSEKIHFVVTDHYPMYKVIEKFLLMQPFTEKVTYVDVASNALDPGCWRFNPAKFGIEGKYLNFGFGFDVHKGYFPDGYAGMYGLGVDYAYTPTLPKMDIVGPERIKLFSDHADGGLKYQYEQRTPGDAQPLDFNRPFEENVLIASQAEERFMNSTSLVVLMDFLNKPCTIFVPHGFLPHMYYRYPYHQYVTV